MRDSSSNFHLEVVVTWLVVSIAVFLSLEKVIVDNFS
jgi:hypothetical protein